MVRLLTLFFLFIIGTSATTVDSCKVLDPISISQIIAQKKLEEKVLERLHENRLILAIATVESGLNPQIVNKSSGASGYLQIMPVLVKEINRLFGTEYRQEDVFDKDKSIEMFKYVMSRFNPDYDIRKACHIWLAGPYSKNLKVSEEYYGKVLKQYNKLLKGV